MDEIVEKQSVEPSEIPAKPKSPNMLFVTIGFIVLGCIILLGLFIYKKSQTPADDRYPSAQMERQPMNNSQQYDDQPTSHKADKGSFKLLTEPQLLFTGGYADPTLVKKGDTDLVMYLNNFSQQPARYEVHTSHDGISWTRAQGTLPDASTGRAVVFGTQTRLYYPDRTPIRPTDPPASILSALSSDGFNFTNEAGTRVDPRDGYYLEGPTVFQLPDRTYKMYFSENDAASAEKRISSIWGATSTDGVTWVRDEQPTIEATVQDERIPSDWPQALHPFVLTRPDGSFLMLYNTHSEVFSATSNDGIEWKKTGAVGIHGADVDGYYVDDKTIRLYYGDFSPDTSGVVYTVDLQETR